MRRKKYNVLNLNKTVELATIETIDSILWLAHYKTTNGLICRPKYIPDCSGLITINFKQYKRLYSPIFKENSDVRNLGYNSIDHDLLFKGLFFIPFRKIKRIYPISRFTPNVRQTTTAKEGQKFLENIICRSPHEKRNIFFMGSISLNCESDGYSDLDVAISDSNTFNRVLCSLNKISGVTFRTKDAWDSFYVKYGVKTLVSKNDFSCSMLNKKNQGFYNKIPFTITLKSGRRAANISISIIPSNEPIGWFDTVTNDPSGKCSNRSAP